MQNVNYIAVILFYSIICLILLYSLLIALSLRVSWFLFIWWSHFYFVLHLCMQVRVLCDKAKEILMEESNVQVRLFFIIYVSMF